MSDPFTPFGTTKAERIASARKFLSAALELVQRARMDVFNAGIDVAALAGLEAHVRAVQEWAIGEAAMVGKGGGVDGAQ